MKKLLLLISIFLSLTLNAQESVLKETIELEISQSELFSKTKMFIADSWNNPKKSIINEDASLGVIQVKTEKEIGVKQGLVGCIYVYEYTTRFRMKDNKYRIEIYDVVCKSAKQIGMGTSNDVPLIPYFEGEDVPEKTKSMGKGVSKKKAIEIMNELRTEFSTIISSSIKYIKTEDDF